MMERIKPYVLPLLTVVNTLMLAMIFLSLNKPVDTLPVAQQPALVNEKAQVFEDKMQTQLFVIENEIRSLKEKVAGKQASIFKQALVAANQQEREDKPEESGAVTDEIDQENKELVGEYVTAIISSGRVTQEDIIGLRQQLSTLDLQSHQAEMQRIIIAINNQELKLEPGVAL